MNLNENDLNCNFKLVNYYITAAKTLWLLDPIITVMGITVTVAI